MPANGKSWEENDFIEAADILGFTIPNQLNNWKRFFISEESFLKAANEWLEAKCNGAGWPTIEDDIDKGLMKMRPYLGGAFENPMVPSTPARKPWQEWEDDYGDAWQAGWSGQQSTGKKWWTGMFSEPLPATPKIPAPSGLSFVDMATVF